MVVKSDVLIRRAKMPGEFVFMAELAVRAWHIAAQDIVLTDHSRDVLEAKFLYDLKENAEGVLVAEYDGEICGWAARVPFSNYISDLWVDPAHHRRGIGTSLLDAIIAQIIVDGFDQADIGTHCDNIPAIRLYEGMGFKVHQSGGEWSESFGRTVEKVRMRIVL